MNGVFGTVRRLAAHRHRSTRETTSFHPLVSILTPSWNQATWLPDNLRSVSLQTYPNIEHVVMDGASSDDTVDILRDWDSSGSRWRSEVDLGQSDALNKALALSQGEIVGWLNSDDAFADRRAIAWVVAMFARYPDVDVVYGHVLDTTDDGFAVRLTWSPPPWVSRLNRDLNPVKQPAAFFRRRAIKDAFVRTDLHYTMDHELFLRLLHSGRAFRRIPRVLSINRHQLQRKSFARPPEYRDEYAAAVGPETWRQATQRRIASGAVSTACRVLGAWSFVSLGRTIAPAASTTLPPVMVRLRLQLMTRTEAYLLARSGQERQQ